MGEFGIVLPTFSELVYSFVLFFVYSFLPIIFSVSFFVKLLIKKFRPLWRKTPHKLNALVTIVSSLLLPAVFLLIIRDINSGIAALTLFLITALCLFSIHEVIDFIMRLKNNSHKVVGFILFILFFIFWYPKSAGSYKYNYVKNQEEVVSCICVGIKTGKRNENKHYCYGLVTSCTQTTKSIPPSPTSPF